MLRLGWQTYWLHVRDVVSPTRARRAFVIAALTTLVAAAVMGALQAGEHWAGRGATAALVVVLMALGVGLVVFASCPIAERTDPAATINGRQVRPDTARTVRWSVRKYLTRTPPPMLPEDRDAVLVDTRLYRRGVTLDLTRGTALVLGGVLAATAGSMVGFTHLWPFFMLLYAANLPTAFVNLGRAERASRTARSLVPLP